MTYIYNRRYIFITGEAGVFLGKCVRTATMVVDRKNKKALVLLYLASEPLRNAANLTVELTEIAAEPTTKMKSSKANFVTRTFRFPPKRQLSISFHLKIFDVVSQVLNFTSVELNRFAKQAKLLKKPFFKSDGGHAISRQENAGYPLSTVRFPAKKK